MRKNIPAAAFLVAVIPACALAQERAPELPSLSSVKGELARPAAPALEARLAAAGQAAKRACMAWPATAQVGRGIFESDYELKIDGRKAAEVQTRDDSILVVSAGAMEASARVEAAGDKRTAAVLGCDGGTLGIVEELVGRGSSAFNIKDASGAPLMTTGWVSGGDMKAASESGSMTVEQNGIFDHFTVTARGVPPQVAVIAAVMNNAAGYRRASERHRERIGEGSHGRGDR